MGIKFSKKQPTRYLPVHLIPTTINLGSRKELRIPDLMIDTGEKIGLFGKNGSGKSSFLKYLINQINFPEDHLLYIPQEISEEESRMLIKHIHAYDNEIKGQLMILVSRLGSDPHRLLESTIPSPGEVRKLMLAEGILKDPALIIMDEPTNHMDLPSVESLEQALRETESSQLLVSHDKMFLRNTVDRYWFFSESTGSYFSIDPEYSI